MVKIENTLECFVQLWLKLERTRQLLAGQPQGNKRLHLGSLFPSFQRRTDAGRNGHTAAAFGQPTQAPRTAPRPRLSLSWNRNAQGAPPATRQSLQPSLPRNHRHQCEQEEEASLKGLLRTMLPERKHRKSTRRLSLTSSSSTSTKSTSRFKREQYQTCLDIAER